MHLFNVLLINLIIGLSMHFIGRFLECLFCINVLKMNVGMSIALE